MSLKIDPDGPAYFECHRCNVAWHAGEVNPAPPVCPSCDRPWGNAPLFALAAHVKEEHPE